MAGEGQNQAARSLLDLEPTAILEFYKLVLDPSRSPNSRREIPFHGGTIFQGNVTWQGQKYIPLAVEAEGFEMLGDRRLPRPHIRISNDNQLITLLLQNNNDLVNAQVVRKKAFVKNLDDVNFDGGNPWGQANANAELLDEVWLIGRKTHESKIMVEFELNSPLDLESFSINSRSVVSKHCAWQYRGAGCRYAGIPIERDNGSPFLDADENVVIPNLTAGGEEFLSNPDYYWNAERTYVQGNVVTVPNLKTISSAGVPVKTCYVCVSGNKGQTPELNPTYWQKDGCTKELYACKKRFNGNNEVQYLLANTEYLDSFNTIGFSGNKNLTNDDAQTAGAFYSLETTGDQQDLTGILTGTFTIAGWVQDNPVSSNQSAIWSTTPRGLEIGNAQSDSTIDIDWASGDSVQFINLGRNAAYERRGDWQPPVAAEELDLMLYQTVGTSDGATPNPIDGSNQINSVKTNITDVGKVDGEWKFYVITHKGPETLDDYNENDDTELQLWLNNTPDVGLLGQEDLSVPKFANLTARQSPYGNFAGLPEQFMLGSIVSGSVHPTMNGKLGPWALWNRQLLPAEREFLYKLIINPESAETVHYAPRAYTECVDDFEDITGNKLVAWWDMTTGLIPNASDPSTFTTNTGLIDIHSGLYWLTGSGFFATGAETSTYVTYQTANNFSTEHPRYGGFPGTDGYGFGRRKT